MFCRIKFLPCWISGAVTCTARGPSPVTARPVLGGAAMPRVLQQCVGCCCTDAGGKQKLLASGVCGGGIVAAFCQHQGWGEFCWETPASPWPSAAGWSSPAPGCGCVFPSHCCWSDCSAGSEQPPGHPAGWVLQPRLGVSWSKTLFLCNLLVQRAQMAECWPARPVGDRGRAALWHPQSLQRVRLSER